MQISLLFFLSASLKSQTIATAMLQNFALHKEKIEAKFQYPKSRIATPVSRSTGTLLISVKYDRFAIS